ncbi:NAC domain-containing protein 74-like isoform X2 [Juglans microcarpa x Juglans regia]|nr:NAC domain-containing protein 74-like isoform X2 [Juglans microcarpa x Juglans regia]
MYPEWWFFLPLDRNGKGMKRATKSGFWKVTGQPMKFMSDLVLIGKKDILVFHIGHGKEGKKTNWVMHQYLVTLKEFDGTHPGQSPFALCRLSYKDEESVGLNFNIAGLAVPYELPALEVQATKTPENFGKTISTTITPVDCDGKSFSAHTAENQVGELIAIEDDIQQDKTSGMIYELQQKPVDCEILARSHLLHNNSAVSSTDKSSLEELESRQALALVSPSSEEQSDNYLGKCHPEETFDGTNFNTTTLSNCNQNGYNASASEFQEGFGFSDLLKPLDCNLFSLLTSDMHIGMSYSVSNDYNHCGIDSLHGVLMKDDGSFSGSDTKMANEPVSGALKYF